jgi:mono/diheme cytochrome c family protein
VSSEQPEARRGRRVLYCLLITAYCLLALGCRNDMHDQPRYEVYEPSQFYEDGQGSRPLVEGTVPRGAQFRDANGYLYTGKMDAGGAGGGTAGAVRSSDAGTQTGAGAGGVGTSAANVQSQPGGGQTTGDVNVRGNVAGGIPAGASQAQQGANMLQAGGAEGNRPPGGAPGGNASATGGPDVFPFPITEDVLSRGQSRFNAFCAMCHGMTGEGDGMIVRRGFRRPPSFHSEQLQPGNASASHFFDVITNGWGAMPDYAAQISAEDRWSIIAYVRALQLARRGRVEDVPPAERGKLSGGAQQPAAPSSGGHSNGGAAQPHGGTQR